MSRQEIQHLVFLKGQFTFTDGEQNEGMIISRYNIPLARVEYYLIPSSNMTAYHAEKSSMEAHKKLGVMVDITSIMHAKMIN